MLIPTIFFLFFQLHVNFGSDILTETDFSVLTRNLIENFRVDPFLAGESASRELSQTSKEFIDKHVERYRQLVLTSKEKEFSRSKRSLHERENEAESRDYNTDLNPSGNVSAFASSDTVFFQQNLQWYAAIITKQPNRKYFNLLKIFKYHDNKFHTIIEAGIENGVRLAAFSLENSTIIVVAENSTELNHTNIYELNLKEEFDIVEKVNGSGYHDVNIWEDNGNVFMSLVGFMANSPVSSSTSRLYKWRGRHFDVLQNIHDTGAARITPFQIGDEGFVAVARNKASRDSEPQIYSEILKYNVATEKYELFQKILTHACEDIKYFEIDAEGATGGGKQGFLIVANFYEKDSQGKINYETSSIIYRYVDEYFIPFQSVVLTGVRQWQPITNEDGDVLLVALTKDGLRSFVYDGWNFIESNINIGGDLKNLNVQDIKAMHSYHIDNKNILVMIRDNPSKNDHLLFEITFSTINKIRQIHDKLLNWCQDTTKEFSSMDEDILERVQRGDIDEELESESQTEASDSEKLISNINKYNSKLFETSNKLKNSLQSSEHHIIERDLEANRIHINSTGILQTVLTDKINNQDVDNILENTLNINDGFRIDSELEIDFLRTEEDLEPKTLNGHPIDSIVYKNTYNDLKNVKILGNAVFKDDVSIGNINGDMKISEDTILLKNKDQNLGNLRVRKVRADNVQVAAVNGQSITTEATGGGPKNNGKEKVRNVKALKTKNLIVGGFLNDVDVPTLEKYALRKSGKQDITAETYYFDRVESELLDTDRLSGIKIPEELILINTGDYVIPKSLLFATPPTIGNLTVLEHLDSISVARDGNLDLLLKNHKFQQHVTGLKTLKNLELLNPINVRGKLKGKDFENIDPLKKIDSDLIIDHDVVIGGDVLVEDFVKSVDITTDDLRSVKEVTKLENINSKDGKSVPESIETNQKKTDKPIDIVLKKDELQSVSRMVEHGVKLTDENVNIPVIFLEHLGIDDIKADTINGVDLDTLVVSGAKHTQVISGWKTFNGDLEISGDTNIFRINNIDTEEFESNILLTDGDQVITGKHDVNSVVVLGSLKANNTKFGTQPWKNVITTTGDQTIDATLTVSQLSTNSTSATNLKIDGNINGINFTKMVEDAVVIDVPQKVIGTKNFTNLNIEHLTVKNNFDVKKKLQEIKDKNLTLEDVDGIESLTANKVYFNNKLNGIHKTKFETVKNDKKTTVEGDHEFEEITVFGNVFIETNEINNIDLDDVEENSIKIDEAQIFNNVEFGNVFVEKAISHKGQIENLDLENIFENGKQENQNILDKIDFRNGLSVTGTVQINGRLNGVKVSELCGVTSESKTNKKMIIEGNVHFVKGPHIAQFNGMSEKELSENLWFTDKPAKLQGNAIFLGNVTMREDMTVHGLLNGINVDYLSSNYLSKTKDQKIVASLTFPNTTVFLKDVTTKHMHVGNLINDIDLKDFLNNVLMHRPQLFEDVVYFEEVTVENLEGNYLVNKLNLDSEVMRYDRPNLITGPKSFGGLHVDVLRPERERATVQEVDVGQWLQGAVLADGNYKIGGRKKFGRMVVEESTNLIGHFNDIKMNSDNIMLKNIAQNITGIKRFTPKYPDELEFKGMKIKGLLNGDDLIDVLNNQANKKEDNDFETQLQFSNKMTAQNVNFMKDYYGINVEQLLKNISTIGTLGSIKEKYHNLMDMVNDVEKSLKDQAFFLNYFKPVPPTFDNSEIFSLNCGSNNNKVISFKNANDSNIRTFLDWDKKQEVFNPCCVEGLGPYPNYMNKINLHGMDVVYIEHRDISKTEDNTHKGQLLSCKNSTTQLFGNFLTKGTLFLKSFEIKSKTLQCLLFIDFSFDINILCSGQDKKYFLQQTIRNDNPVMASILLIEDLPYLATIHQEVDNKTVIWKLNKDNQFEVYTTYREGDPISVSTVSTKNGIFLAVAYKHLPNTKDFGKIIIRRFDESSQTFTTFQNIKLETPTQILFAELPSEEIVLYVTTQIPAEHFIAYLYQGVFGFVKKIGSSTIREAIDIKDVTLNKEHFVVVKHVDDMTVLQAVFKGNRYDIEN